MKKMIHTRILGKIGRKQGGSYHITLPLEEINRLGWREGQLLFVEAGAHGLTIRKADYRPRSTSSLKIDK